MGFSMVMALAPHHDWAGFPLVIDFTKRQNHFAKLADRENGVVLVGALGDVRHAGASLTGFSNAPYRTARSASVIFAGFFAGGCWILGAVRRAVLSF